MGSTARQLEQVGSRRTSPGIDSLEVDRADRLASTPGGEHGADLYCQMVRGFGGPRAVSVPPRRPRRETRSGIPTARAGQRVVGFAVRGRALSLGKSGG